MHKNLNTSLDKKVISHNAREYATFRLDKNLFFGQAKCNEVAHTHC